MRRLPLFVLAIACGMCASVLTESANAASIPAYAVSPAFTGTVDTDPNAYSAIGFEFTTATPLSITHLGYNANQEYAGVREVSITAVGGGALSPALTANVTVPTGGTANNVFVYTELGSPYSLAAGTYWITAPIPAGLGYHFSNNPAHDIEAPGITYVNGVVGTGTSGARFYNVNFQFVPEPTSFALCGLGLLGMLAVSRRIRR